MNQGSMNIPAVCDGQIIIAMAFSYRYSALQEKYSGQPVIGCPECSWSVVNKLGTNDLVDRYPDAVHPARTFRCAQRYGDASASAVANICPADPAAMKKNRFAVASKLLPHVFPE